jgi:hypothetical protein
VNEKALAHLGGGRGAVPPKEIKLKTVNLCMIWSINIITIIKFYKTEVFFTVVLY